MAIFKQQLKKILGLASIAILFAGIVTGVLTKERNSSKASSSQSLRGDYRFENRNFPDLEVEIEQPKKICIDLLEKDENAFVFDEYSKVEVVECMFVGCGGFF